jgi:hypothetical protein
MTGLVPVTRDFKSVKSRQSRVTDQARPRAVATSVTLRYETGPSHAISCAKMTGPNFQPNRIEAFLTRWDGTERAERSNWSVEPPVLLGPGHRTLT